MTEKEQKKAAKEFAERWKGRGYEKGESNLFWIDLLTHVYGVDNIAEFISFEDQVHLDHTSFIDGYIKSTHVMIEQKSIGKDLRKAIKQSDGSLLNPFQQAKRYVTELPLSQHPRWIVTCNFEEFLVYDMEKPNGEPEQIFLKDLAKDYYRLQFLVETGSEMLKKEMEISLKAGELVGKLYDAILKQYKEPDSPETLKSLNMLCVRLVFCLYAEDAGIFGKHEMFGRYLKQFQAKDIRKALIELFQVLDQKPEDRDPYMDDDLAAFPYVNGGLFADENIEIPRFTDEIVDLLVNNASAGFDWSEISPTIFGAVFESTLNPETRRSGGMHYTSIENIHKVIDPLFLDELKAEFNTICETKVDKTRKAKLEQFRDKLASLTFLDPACGSGNFLTETYISLRRLENEALKAIHGDQILLGGDGDFNPIKVGIGQFYGIEINDFAVTVAKTALWIAEAQMMHETEEIIQNNLDFLPLKSYANITEGNSLLIDWESVVSKEKLSYIMGNPPFVGFTFMSKEQKDDIQKIFPDVKNLDFVAGWYKKASDYIQETNIECGFVSTNSITQGETVCRLWKHLSIIINFAYLSFIWDSEANQKAQVHCVIIGFSCHNRKEKYLYKGGIKERVENINYYLCDAPNVIVESRNKPLCDVPKMVYGNKPADGGYLIIEADEYDEFIKQEPQAQKYIHRLLGATEFINNKLRYCLWLVGVSPAEIKKCPLILERVRKCKEQRESSIAAGIRKFAETPTLFAQITQPEGKPYIIIPRHSSERRKYIPFGFVDPDVKVNDAVQIIPDATLYHFAILMSNVHMAWTKAVCGRIKSDYRYSKDVVYNNFPWCNPTDEQKAVIEHTAQLILDARAKYPDCSLADLYDELTMPPELRKAHQLNDKAVMQAYGFDYKTMTESECVAELMKMYQRLTKK
ncbi:DNA methyltransferase [Ruminococcus albus]|uniref:site-specific DNA-methyltransferase (adenine-specific) n=1 Tax=Ruminococcus albus TaxID=1264 RepID=A0A1I1RQX0_RUMAL|nr:DNA methyltransferase [Ruminococcus albus]SFD36407.1 Type II restriction/modification system, DNA methylase subunit YeeA [Ruminococcus albus]